MEATRIDLVSPPPRDVSPGAQDSLIVVVGGDALALAVCGELCRMSGNRISLLWNGPPGLAGEVTRMGAVCTHATPDNVDNLGRASVAQATTILALSDDDRLNLHVALQARDLNPSIRIVLRQFNRSLGRKVEQNLPDCSVLSLASHSAATYAAAALDPSCFRGLQFPDIDGPLTGFARRSAAACGAAGLTRQDAERRLNIRILAVDGDASLSADTVIAEAADLVIFGTLAAMETTMPRTVPVGRVPFLAKSLSGALFLAARWGHRIDPLVMRLVLVALLVFACATWYFHQVLGSDLLTAAYFVATTMSTTGYGDITPDRDNPVAKIIAIAMMMSGIGFVGIFTALVTASLTRSQMIRMQGLRRIRRRGHIVVCGAGNIGTAVIEYLLETGRRIVVVERRPDPVLIEWAHERRIELLTGDATRDATLRLCNLAEAHSLVVLTNNDTMNLETALGARAINPSVPAILRIADADFASTIARHFSFSTTFSADALTAPAFTGLSRFPDTRGRISFAGRDYGICDRPEGDSTPSARPGRLPLAVWHRGAMGRLADFADARPGDRVLFLEPLDPFRRPDGAAWASDFVPPPLETHRSRSPIPGGEE